MKLFLGFDPGLSGAMAAITEAGAFWTLEDLPTIAKGGIVKKELDAAGLARLVRPLVDDTVVAVVEQVAARPGQGTASVFSLGNSLGCIVAVLQTLGVPVRLVPPHLWKRALQVSTLAKAGMPVDDLEAAIVWREQNLDPRWEPKAPPPPPDPRMELIVHTLTVMVPRLLWRAEHLALALREAGITACTPTQIAKAQAILALLNMELLSRALGNDNLNFDASTIPSPNSPEHAALVQHLEHVMAGELG